MSSGPIGRPKTVVFRPRVPGGGQATAKPPAAAVQPVSAVPAPPVQPPEQPAVPVSSAEAVPQPASASEVQETPQQVAVEPAQASVPAPVETGAPDAIGGVEPAPDPDRPRSRKFTLKKSSDELPPGNAAPAVAAPVEAGQPSGAKGKFRFGKKGAAVPEAPAAPAVAEAAQGAAAAPVRKVYKSYIGAYAKLSVWGLLVCLISFVIFWLATRGSTAGHFGAIVGRVEIVSRNYMRIAESQCRVVSGDVIKSTTPSSSGIILISGNDSMQIYGESTASIRVTKMTEKLPEGRIIDLASGTIDLDVGSAVPGRIVSVLTTNAIVSFNSARFLLVHTNGCTRLSVREGVVTIGQRGGEKKAVEVQAGFEVNVADGIPFMPKSLSGDTMVKDLFLVMAVEGSDVEGVDSPLKSEVVLDRNKVTGLLGVRATTVPDDVGSVKFEMQGCPPVIVSEPPYIFKGKPNPAAGDGWKPDRGEHTLVVTVYSKKDGKGKPSIPKSVMFKVKGAVDY